MTGLENQLDKIDTKVNATGIFIYFCFNQLLDILTHLRRTTFENKVENGEIAHCSYIE